MISNPQAMTTERIRAAMADNPPPCSSQPDLFFEPDTSENKGEKPAAKEMRERSAKALCHGCPVRALCLELARREAPAYGIWAGLTATEIRNDLKGVA